MGTALMRKRIDAHVHITPATALGKRNERFGTENLPYGRLKMGDGGFQTMPCYVHDSQFTDDTLINMMNVYGIERAVLLQSLMNPMNDEIARAVRKYPERLIGAMVVEPKEGWQEEMHRLAQEGLRVIKFEMRAFTHPACYPNAQYDDPMMSALFDEAEALGLTITIDPAPVDFPVYNPRALAHAVEQHPNAHFVLCHLGYPMPLENNGQYEKWHEMVRMGQYENCWLDVSAMPDLFDAEGWPYPSALDLIRMVQKEIGADKLIWGSDITGTLNRATYPQMIDMFERRSGFAQEELDQLFYDNAAAAYRIQGTGVN